MKLRDAMLRGLTFILGGLISATAAHQNAPQGVTVRSIDVGGARPLLRAVEALRESYHVAITYEEPRYIYMRDLEDISYMHKGPVPSGVKLVAPRGGIIHFHFAEVNGKPQEDMTSLIHRLLAEYEAQGGPVFDVRERTTPKGTEWNVVALKAHGSSGSFVDQPDILGAPVFIPKTRRSGWEFLDEMLRQVQTETGYRVVFGTVETKLVGEDTFGADNVSARDVLAKLLGTEMVWDLNYDPEGEGKYVLNLVQTPRPPQPPNPYTIPKTPPAELPPTGSAHIPIPAVMRMAAMPRGIRHIQSVLAQAGYYEGEPSGQWDEKTIDGLKRFQAANNIPVTGKLDPETIRKLGLDVVTPKPQ